MVAHKYEARIAGLVRSGGCERVSVRARAASRGLRWPCAGARGELADAFELLLNLWTWPARSAALGLVADQLLDGGAECFREQRHRASFSWGVVVW